MRLPRSRAVRRPTVNREIGGSIPPEAAMPRRKRPSDTLLVTRKELNRLMALGCFCGSLPKGEECEHCTIIKELLEGPVGH